MKYISHMTEVRICEWTLTCDVVDDHRHGGVPDVAGDEAPEALLSRRVPQLQPDLRFRETQLRLPPSSESLDTLGSPHTLAHTAHTHNTQNTHRTQTFSWVKFEIKPDLHTCL